MYAMIIESREVRDDDGVLIPEYALEVIGEKIKLQISSTPIYEGDEYGGRMVVRTNYVHEITFVDADCALICGLNQEEKAVILSFAPGKWVIAYADTKDGDEESVTFKISKAFITNEGNIVLEFDKNSAEIR